MNFFQPETTNTKSSPNNSLNELNRRFGNAYFSGAQAQIIIGDYIVDEVIEIEGTYSVNKIPIYGYASKHFNSVATGKVLVAGMLSINYVANGYLWAYIKELLNKKKEQASVLDGFRRKTRTSVEQPIRDSKSTKYLDVYQAAVYNDLDTQTINKLETAYWDTDSLSAKNKLRGFNENKFLRPEFIGPFNIKIRDFRLGSTVTTEEKIIVDCFLDKYSTMRRSDGSPSVEVYTFIAKTII